MKIRVGLLIGYKGTEFHGLQYNDEIKTVERVIVTALHKFKCIRDENANDPQKIGLQRACRTDKKVHAALNLITVKIIRPINEIEEDLKIELQKEHIFLYRIIKLPKSFYPKNRCDSRIYKYYVPKSIVVNFNLFSEILKKFKGSKNFFNFTIKSSTCGKMRVIHDVEVREVNEFYEIKIWGQSFMLHQIRKMVGFCLALDNYNKYDNFDLAFTTDLNIPKAPGEYLMLYKPLFDHFNKRFEATHEKIIVEEQDINKICDEYLLPEIFRTENLMAFEVWKNTLEKYFAEFSYLK